MNKVFISVLFVLSFSTAWSQSAKKFNRLGEKSLTDEDLASALVYFDSAKSKDPEDPLYWYNYGSTLFLLEQYAMSINALEESINNDADTEFSQAYLLLAKAYQYSGEYEKADQTYNRVIEKGKRFPVYKSALKAQKASLTVAKLFSNPVKIDLETINISNIGSLYNPVLFKDSLVFTALYKPKDQMVLNQQNYSFKLSSNDSVALEVDSNLFVYHPDSTVRFTTLYEGQEKRIHISYLNVYEWSEPKPFEVLNAFNDCFQPHIAEINGKVYLFFTTSDEQAMQHRGGTDIYWLEIKSRKGKIRFGNPRNLGKKINTSENEITPYFSEVYQEFWFSSTGHPGLGNFDMFKASFTGKSISKPVNMGYPINTFHSEINPFNKDSIYYFISDRNLHKNCFETTDFLRCNELFKYQLLDSIPEDTTEILVPPSDVDLNTELSSIKLLPLNLYFDNDQPNPNSRKTTTEFNWTVLYQNYLLEAESYKNRSADPGMMDAFFKYTLPTSETDLDSLAQIVAKELAKGNNVHLGMQGFTSALAANNYNLNLSERRLSSVENYFNEFDNGSLKKFIDQNRLVFHHLPQGEIKSQNSLDDLHQKNKSVYGFNAMLWRKVEIAWIEIVSPKDTLGNIVLSEYYLDLGSFDQDSVVEISVTADNPTIYPIQIDSIQTSCGCTTTTINLPFQINAQSRKDLTFTIDIDKNQKGPHEKVIQLFNNGLYPEKWIIVKYWVK